MSFFVFGLNHKTAPLSVLEEVARLSARPNDLLLHLINGPATNEAVLLPTCNRTEFYCESEEPQALFSWFMKEHGIEAGKLSPYFYHYEGEEGIRHTLRVASGLDSMMLGEPQILGQMKQAYQQACLAGTVKSQLRRTFEYVFSASKRIRNRSGIGENPVSVAYAAVQLVLQTFKDLAPLEVFIIGSGETASLVAKYLYKQGARKFHVASRTPENAEQLAANYGAFALSINDIAKHLPKADIVISATACPLPFIHKNMVEQALVKRAYAPMFLIDLSLPRDIEPEVKEIEQVELYNLKDLQVRAEQGMDERRTAAIHAEALIDSEVNNYVRWHRILGAKQAICDYRSQMQALANQELTRAKAQLAAGINQEEVLYEFSRRMLSKWSHHPTLGLKKAALDGRDDLLSLIYYLFNQNCDPLLS